MQFEDVFRKYIGIFNVFGESYVMASDFQLANRSIRKRIQTCIAIFISLVVIIALQIGHFLHYDQIFTFTTIPNAENTINVMFFISVVSTKIVCISQMPFTTNLLPEFFDLVKELQSITNAKYQMDFQQFNSEFVQNLSKMLLMWLIKLIIIYKFDSTTLYDAMMNGSIDVAVFLSYMTIFYAYFYVLLFKHIILFYVIYMVRKATIDKPTTFADLKVELIFFKTNHYKLYEIANTLNAAFGWIFVAIFFQAFFEITFDLYLVLSEMECSAIYHAIRN